jgi:hypothetical protein
LTGHPERLAGFDAALRGGAVPGGLTARSVAEVERRFAVYRNNVAVGLSDALAARFPVIQRLVGEAFFAAMARVFAEAHRPRSPVIAEWGGEFPRFLAGFPPLAAWPYMADVARIELARGVAFHAADAEPVDPAALVAADPERVVLALHPSVCLLRLDHPAVSIWARNQPGGEGVPVGSGPETALVLRDRAFAVQVRALGAGDAALVEALLAGATLAEAALRADAAVPGHDPQPILVDLMRAGAITQPKV